MLVLLCASLFFTAIIVKKTYTTTNSLGQTGKTLEHNLQKKEGYVNAVINDKKKFNELKVLDKNPFLGLAFYHR
jgi:two-component system nitrogen regulation sensor histidine kinase NtrY